MEVFSEILWSGSIALAFSIAFVRRTTASVVFACAFIATIAIDPWSWPAFELVTWYASDSDGKPRFIGNSPQRFFALHYSWRLTLGAVTAIAMALAARKVAKTTNAGTQPSGPKGKNQSAPSQLSIRSIFALISLSAWYIKALQNPTPLFEMITVVITIAVLAFATAHAAKTKSTTAVIFLCVVLTLFYFPPMSRFRHEIVVSLGKNVVYQYAEAYTILRHAIAITTSAAIAVFGRAFIWQIRTNKAMRVVVTLALLASLYFASYDFLGDSRGGPIAPSRVFRNKAIATFYRPAAGFESLYTTNTIWIGSEAEWDEYREANPYKKRLAPILNGRRGIIRGKTIKTRRQ